MCGRFTLTTDADTLREEFGITELPDDYRPRYNIAPAQPVLAIAPSREGGIRTGDLLWGLVPWFTEGKSARKPIINVRAETLGTRFRHHFERRRCLIPADGFYEWRKDAAGSVPMRVRRPDGRPFAFAGIWDRVDREGDAPLHTCAIVTTAPTPEIARIHDRMPLLLDTEDRATWLDRAAPAEEVRRLLRPWAGQLEAYRVSTRVNSVRYDDPACIEPADPGGQE